MDKNRNRLLWKLSFVLYVCVMVYFLFFAENMGRGPRHYSYNLVPFREIKRYIRHMHVLGIISWMNLAGNVVAFIPYGIFLPKLFLPKAGPLMVAFFTMISSLLIETFQLVFRVGSFDVDDIILNTLGGLLGGLIYLAAKKIFKGGN